MDITKLFCTRFGILPEIDWYLEQFGQGGFFGFFCVFVFVFFRVDFVDTHSTNIRTIPNGLNGHCIDRYIANVLWSSKKSESEGTVFFV